MGRVPRCTARPSHTHLVPPVARLPGLQARDFTIVFRSFGTDLGAVLDEVDVFARGAHPDYPSARLDGSDGRTDLRVTQADDVGVFVRTSVKPDGTLLLVGAPRSLLAERAPLTEADLEAAAAATPGARLLRGFAAIHRAVMAQTCLKCGADAAAELKLEAIGFNINLAWGAVMLAFGIGAMVLAWRAEAHRD